MTKYITVYEFARKSKRQPSNIFRLIKAGNQFRKLKAKKGENELMIPETELYEFPFTRNDYINILETKIKTLKNKCKKCKCKGV